MTATGPIESAPWTTPLFTLAVACTTLKGGRGDWLVEKATELGAFALLPILTERSPGSPRLGLGNSDRSSAARQAGVPFALTVALRDLAQKGDKRTICLRISSICG